MIFSLVAMTRFEKCCITSAFLQWLCHSGEQPVGLYPTENHHWNFRGIYLKFQGNNSPKFHWYSVKDLVYFIESSVINQRYFIEISVIFQWYFSEIFLQNFSEISLKYQWNFTQISMKKFIMQTQMGGVVSMTCNFTFSSTLVS